MEVERRAAEFFRNETSLYFASGYVSNHLLVMALESSSDVVLVDEAAHYCVNEAALLTRKPIVRFQHRDPEHLAQLLKDRLPAKGRPLVLTDGVFAATGALAPVPEYLQTLASYDQASLVVDDAHGIAVLGEQGCGTLEYYGLWDRGINESPASDGPALFLGGTLSKAMGGYGGIIPASYSFLRTLTTSSHYFEGASAPASSLAAASAKAIEIVMREPELRSQLADNIRTARQRLRGLGVTVRDEPSAVIDLRIGTGANMKRIHARLKTQGILVPYVPAYPGVAVEGLLRIAICAAHTPEMIDTLITTLAEIL
jgi:7-keto-8-aminopelargonate synthetase-like enzyme